MKIQQLDLTARDLVAGCHDDDGLVGYGGARLDLAIGKRDRKRMR